jgi:hypothetical protein
MTIGTNMDLTIETTTHIQGRYVTTIKGEPMPIETERGTIVRRPLLNWIFEVDFKLQGAFSSAWWSPSAPNWCRWRCRKES